MPETNLPAEPYAPDSHDAYGIPSGAEPYAVETTGEAPLALNDEPAFVPAAPSSPQETNASTSLLPGEGARENHEAALISPAVMPALESAAETPPSVVVAPEAERPQILAEPIRELEARTDIYTPESAVSEPPAPREDQPYGGPLPSQPAFTPAAAPTVPAREAGPNWMLAFVSAWAGAVSLSEAWNLAAGAGLHLTRALLTSSAFLGYALLGLGLLAFALEALQWGKRRSGAVPLLSVLIPTALTLAGVIYLIMSKDPGRRI